MLMFAIVAGAKRNIPEITNLCKSKQCPSVYYMSAHNYYVVLYVVYVTFHCIESEVTCG